MKRMNHKTVSALILFLFLFGCAAPTIPNFSHQPVYLGDPGDISKKIKNFQIIHDLTTEDGKIDYLIERIRSSNLSFIRNGETHSSSAAAVFLRAKIFWYQSRYHVPIHTASAFIDLVANRSTTTGRPYEVILANGTREKVETVLQSELDFLNQCLKTSCYTNS